MPSKSVLVLGYSGTMGRRVVRLLREYLPEVVIVGASRTINPTISPNSNANHNEVITLETRKIDHQDEQSVREGLHDIDFLIHAAGPFNHSPSKLIKACVESNVHYIDISESLDFIQSVKTELEHYPNCLPTFVSGCSTVPGLVATLAKEFEHCTGIGNIQVLLNMGSRNPVTLGLLFSLLRPIGLPIAQESKQTIDQDIDQDQDQEKEWYREFMLFKHLDDKIRQYANYPIPFEKSISIGSNQIPISFSVGFDRKYINYSLYLMSYLTSQLSDKKLIFLCKCLLPFSGLAKLFGGEAGHLSLVARDENKNLLAQIEIKAEKDGLDIPALTAVWALQAINYSEKLTAQGEKKTTISGFKGLEDIVHPDHLIDDLKNIGYTVLTKDIS